MRTYIKTARLKYARLWLCFMADVNRLAKCTSASISPLSRLLYAERRSYANPMLWSRTPVQFGDGSLEIIAQLVDEKIYRVHVVGIKLLLRLELRRHMCEDGIETRLKVANG